MSVFKKKKQSNEMPSVKPKVSKRKRDETLNLALTAGEKTMINDGAAKAGDSEQGASCPLGKGNAFAGGILGKRRCVIQTDEKQAIHRTAC